VAPLLLEVARRHPRLELEVSFSDRRVDLVEEGFDLAVRGGPLADSAGLVSRRLGTQVMVVCGAPSYLAERGRPESLADLARHECVGYGRKSYVRPWRFPDAEGRMQEAPITSRVRFDDTEAIAVAAVAGAGLALLPSWLVADRMRSGELVRVLEGVPGMSCEIRAIWPQARHLPSRVRVAVNALVARTPALLAVARG